MSSLIHFSPELSSWINHNLDQGHQGADLIAVMHQQKMPLAAAQSIVAAFIAARQSGQATPTDHLEIPDHAAEPSQQARIQPSLIEQQRHQPPPEEYIYGTPIFPPGNRIITADRQIQVLARAQRPTMAVLGNVMSPEECHELISLAKPRLAPSTIVDPMTGKDKVADHRSSLGMFFRLNENPFIARLDQRIASVMNMPVENGEGIQILYYPEGAQSTLHYDFLVPSNPLSQPSIARSGQRISTLVTYLNEVEEGGETIFSVTGWSVTPQRGNAVYFEYGHRAEAEHAPGNTRTPIDITQADHSSLHASNPVIRGEKWVATKWMRQRRFVSA